MDNIQRSRSAVARIPVPGAAHLAIAAALVTPVLLASLRVLSPEFDPSYRMISEYALGSYGRVLSLMFLTWGLSSCALALAIQSQIRTRGGRVGVAFLIVAGIGQALASVFDIRHDVMHNLAGAMGILGLPIAATLISVSLGRNPEWSPFKRHLLVMGNLTWISVILFVGAFIVLIATFIHVNGGLPTQAPPALPHGVVGLVGWANRLLVVVDCAWVVAVGTYAIRLRPDGA